MFLEINHSSQIFITLHEDQLFGIFYFEGFALFQQLKQPMTGIEGFITTHLNRRFSTEINHSSY